MTVPDKQSLRFPLADAAQVRAQLWRQLRRCPGAGRQSLGALLLLVIGSAANITVPLQLGRLVDIVIADAPGTTARLWTAGAWLVVAAVVAASFSAAGFYLVSRVSERVIANLREEMIGTALGLPVHRVEDAGSGDLVSRSTDDVALLSSAVTETVPLITNSAFTLAATAVALVALDWQFLLIPLVTIPIYVVSARSYLRNAPGRYARERAAVGERARRVLEAIHGRETVRAYRWEERMHDSVQAASRDVVDKGFLARLTMITLQITMTFADFVLVVLGLAVGFVTVSSGDLSIGAVTAAMLMLIRLHGPVASIMRVLDSIQSGYASLARIVGVTLDPPRAVPDAGAPAPRGQVDMRGVSFSYGGGWAVRDIDLGIRPGETVAVVGASGAGKTTVAALLAGLRVPDEGQVLLDAVPVTELSDAERADRLAMVSQDVHVFSGTLREDLSLARPGATDEEMISALAAVHADWFEDFPEGLDTQVGGGGLQLEPVEAQQLALARIVLLNPRVVVMDEATAEAGSAGAGDLEAAAEHVTHGRSALIVAHRLDQAARADRVLVMDEGRIVESGPHEELVARGGLYTELWDAWSIGRGDEASSEPTSKGSTST
ncbi:ABC transporter ATP-binding protein [Corynebacterium guangdongense]|uniref:ABC-type multidrug transport system fused ATPase/permease subunit n=1 Tax=Corynebacterium guangdongense TaxID=1783348 RepID=A0ABU1ZWH7_9CORY|nr:ABC transporter ATP-binding protein [Corynebacterium guangdongense]MDR7329289.1 ABC-type multidrug transport system fused ATPase/permease subunit [Corynebacterium guangdongense]WJZ17855.1 Putative multidrug export ATP-binding/permease protein [Corynebacterium guangdongense]